MKKFLLAASLLGLSASAFSAAQLATISRFEYGKQWAFTREEVQLICRPGKALFVLNTATLAQYPLNAIAQQQAQSGKIKALAIETILLDDAEQPGQKMNLLPFQQRAEALCLD